MAYALFLLDFFQAVVLGCNVLHSVVEAYERGAKSPAAATTTTTSVQGGRMDQKLFTQLYDLYK